MSLPTSFFHNQVQLGGGGWALLFSSTNNMNSNGMRKSIRWQHTVGSGYAGMYEYGGSLTFGGLRMVKFANDGTVENTWMRSLNNDHFEPRSFDVWNNGHTISIAEAGGSTFMMATDENGTIADTERLSNVSFGSGFIYGWSIEAIQKPLTGNGGLDQNDRYFYFGASVTSGGEYKAYRGQTWQAGEFVGIYQQNGITAGSNTIYPWRILYSTSDGLSADGMISFGRNSGTFGQSSYFHSYDGNMSSTVYRQNIDVGQYNDFDEIRDACWHSRPQGITNANRRWYAVGKTENTSAYTPPFIMKGTASGYDTSTIRAITRVNGSTANGSTALGVEYDHVNGNRVYVIGYMNKPNDSTSTVKDGYCVCLNVTDDNGTAPTIEWAIAAEQLENGTRRNILFNSVSVDDEGCPIINAMYTDGSQVERPMVVRLAADGSSTGVVNVSSNNNITLYDATSLLQLTGLGQQSSSPGLTTGYSVSVANHTGTSPTGNITNTLVEF